MKIKKILFLLLIVILIVPNLANANIIISEIMYDPEGADTGREWIEIQNMGTENTEILDLKIFESNVNHKISIYSDSNYNNKNSILKPLEYAVIADNPQKFLIDWTVKNNTPFSGLLFDSAFSLNNTGEIISILNSAGNILNTFTYSSEYGASDTGNSLQFNEGLWIPAIMTPGTTNSIIKANENISDSDDKTSTTTDSTDNFTPEIKNQTLSTHSTQTDLSNLSETSVFKISSGRSRLVSINTPIEFNSKFDSKNKPKLEWVTGDGMFYKGKKIKHTYFQAGNYNLVLNAKTKDQTATSRTKVKVFEPTVDILLISMGKAVDIMLKNKSQFELNLGEFRLEVGEKTFIFPKDTIIDSKSELVFDHRITKFYDFKEVFVNSDEQQIADNQIQNSLNNSTNTDLILKIKTTLFYPNGEILQKIN
jgi:hypothetical protein